MKYLDIDYGGILQTLYDFAISIIQWAGSGWNFLSSPIDLGFMQLTPFAMFGGTLIFTLFIMFLVKTFTPFL